METGANNTQSVDKSMSTMQQEVETATEVSARGLKRSASAVSPITSEDEFTSDSSGDDDDNDDDSDDDDYDDYNALSCEELMLKGKKDYERKLIEADEKYFKERVTRMKPIRSLFGTHPELETIAKDWVNRFVDSNLTKFVFTNATRDGRETNPEDLKCIVNLCGSSLTILNIYKYCSSSIMPLIKSNCSNLKKLTLHLHTIEDQNFENCFSNMHQLEVLMIRLKCENSTVPMTLAKSLEQVCETLKTFSIHQDELCSPDSSVSVISSSTKALMTVITNMKNISKLTVRLDHGITNEFLKNLINNAQTISYLSLRGTHITDAGIKALNDAKQLESFSLELFNEQSANELITDQSLQQLYNKKITTLRFSNCINVTNKGVIALAKNLPNLQCLFVHNTQVTDEVRKEIDELKKCGRTNLFVIPLCYKWLH